MTATAHAAPIWFTSRAAGIAALDLCTLSLTLGLAMATRLLPRRYSRVNTRITHESLAAAALAMIGLHGLALLADPYLRPGLAGLVVPFASPYRPLATALGQIAAYGIAGLALSFYARRAIGAARWRSAHRWVTLFWGLSVIHGATAGTDRAAWWFLLAVGLPLVPALFLVIERLAPGEGRAPRTPSTARS